MNEGTGQARSAIIQLRQESNRAATSDCSESGPMGEIARSTVSIVQELQPNQQARSLKLWIA